MMTSPNDELSERELEILEEVATGATNRQIALRLSISVNTVKTHLRNIYAKLGVDSRTEATFHALQNGLIVMGDQDSEPSAKQEADQAAESPWVAFSRVPWRVGGGQWLALAGGILLTFLILLWPETGETLATANNPFVDMPRGERSELEIETSARWSTKSQMPAPRGRFAQVSAEGLIYVISGMNNDGWISTVDIYDPQLDRWRHGAPKPQAVANVGGVTIGGRIYVPGGMNAEEQPIDTLAVYDPAADEWTEGPRLPEALCAYAISPYGQGFYLFGGWNGVEYLTSVYYYDVTQEMWRQESSAPAERVFAAAGTAQDKIYIVGGLQADEELASCLSYDPAKELIGEDPWQSCAPMSMPRSGHALVAFQDSLYAVGGAWQGGAPAYNERYDVSGDRWTRFESPLIGEWRWLGLSAHDLPEGTFLYALGGWNGQRYLAATKAYQAFFRVYVP